MQCMYLNVNLKYNLNIIFLWLKFYLAKQKERDIRDYDVHY